MVSDTMTLVPVGETVKTLPTTPGDCATVGVLLRVTAISPLLPCWLESVPKKPVSIPLDPMGTMPMTREFGVAGRTVRLPTTLFGLKIGTSAVTQFVPTLPGALQSVVVTQTVCACSVELLEVAVPVITLSG